MATHVLMMNLRGSSWDFIPDELWRHILTRFLPACCDAVSFDTVAIEADIGRFDVFSEHTPAYIGQASYHPHSVPASAPDPESYTDTVAQFQFDKWIASLIAQQPFNTWDVDNDGADADELLFWAGDNLKLQAIPYEGQAYFDNLTHGELQLLISVDKRIQPNLRVV